MKILIGYDGSDYSDAALIDLQRAGLPDNAEATVLSVADVFLPSKSENLPNEEIFPLYIPHSQRIAREKASQAYSEAESIAIEGGEKLGKMFPNWKIKTEARAETPYWAIIEKAEKWQPDLIVVGSRGRSALGRFVFGSVSQTVLYETECSVRIARISDKSGDEPIRLILGTDGSPDSDKMIETVASRHWKKGTQIRLITAVEIFNEYAIEPVIQMTNVRAFQNAAAKKLEKKGLEVVPVLTDEDPKHFIVRKAAEWEADCIFLGAQGHRFLERILVGSVSSSVAARAHCSVEVVRRKK